MTLPTLAVLCGGLGTRLGDHVRDLPKSLVPVAGEPFLAHQLRLFHRQGFKRVVLLIGHRGEQIRDFAGDGSRFGLDIAYDDEGPVRRGTGGATRHALPLLGDPFCLTYGDSFLECDPLPIVQRFRDAGAPALMTVAHNHNLWDRSNVAFDGVRVLCHDKNARDMPGIEWIDWGLSVFTADAILRWTEADPFDLSVVTRRLASLGSLAGFEVARRFYEIGRPEGLAETEAYIVKRFGGRIAARHVY